MKPLIKLLFISIITLASCKKQNEQITDNKKAFKAVENLVQNVFDDIWSDKKAELITKYHTDNFILLEHGEVWNNDTIANWCKRAKLRDKGLKRINGFDFIKAEKEGNRIWMAYHNFATIKSDSLSRRLQWLESIVAIKKDSVWKLEMMHSTRVKRN